MYLVTGGAGFIGSNLVKALNSRGIEDIIVVDNLHQRADKFRNLVDCEIKDFIDKEDFFRTLSSANWGQFQAVFHQGACSNTMEMDGRYMMENNYQYSKILLDQCQRCEIPFLYASSAAVYGAGTVFSEQRELESPLNVYGYSKFLFDQHVRRLLPTSNAQIVGFRYFNVYGEGEQHKGNMASVAWHFFNQYQDHGQVKLFRGSGAYADGEQRRDFVYVEDLVKVNMEFLDHPNRSGIFNLGTGRAQSFNDVAVSVVSFCRKKAGKPLLTLSELVAAQIVTYVDFPEGLANRYQSYTQADLTRLRQAGYRAEFSSVESGVADYLEKIC